MTWTKKGLLAATILLAGATQTLACEPTYIISPGDSLSGIAEDQLGTVFGVEQLYQANIEVIGDNPDRILAGQEIRIPCDDAAPGQIDWTVMPNPDAVAQLLAQRDLQVLDIRNPAKLEGGIIRGAISMPFSMWRGPADNPGEPPSEERIARMIGEAGLHLDKPIVIVHSREHPMQTGAASVVYWILKSSGAEQLAILRGGQKGWVEAGLPTVDAFSRRTPYVATVDFDWQWRADEVTVYGIATKQIPGAMLDARPHGAYARVDKLGEIVATTLPGARNLSAPSLFSALRGEIDIADGVETVLEAFSQLAVDGDVVTFCNVGELAALNWFYASEIANLENIKLYPESLKGWTEAGGYLFAGSDARPG